MLAIGLRVQARTLEAMELKINRMPGEGFQRIKESLGIPALPTRGQAVSCTQRLAKAVRICDQESTRLPVCDLQRLGQPS